MGLTGAIEDAAYALASMIAGVFYLWVAEKDEYGRPIPW